jgi:ketosteroid isomerase-like protein
VKAAINAAVISLLVLSAACSNTSRRPAGEDSAGIDSLNARLSQAYREKNPQMYGTVFTDSAVFEWPAFTTVRGRAGMERMARTNWAALNDMDLKLTVVSRRFADDHATEFGAFEQSFRDAQGARMKEFGRYVHVLLRQGDDTWRIDRFFGFSDSTRQVTTQP